MIDFRLREKFLENKKWKDLSEGISKISKEFSSFNDNSIVKQKENQGELTKYMLQRFDFQIALFVEMLKVLKKIEKKLK